MELVETLRMRLVAENQSFLIHTELRVCIVNPKVHMVSALFPPNRRCPQADNQANGEKIVQIFVVLLRPHFVAFKNVLT